MGGWGGEGDDGAVGMRVRVGSEAGLILVCQR